jgi:surfeit locus 1 family protein
MTGTAPRRLTYRLLPTLAAIAGLFVTVSACLWQYGRGQEKDRLAAEIADANRAAMTTLSAAPIPEDRLRFRRVRARGVFRTEATVLLDNQAHGGVPGYHVYMPLRLADSDMHVLVKRGWVQGSLDRSVLPVVRTPEGELTVEGLALPPNPRFLELSGGTREDTVWQNVTLDRVREAYPLEYQPLILEQHNEAPDGLVRQWPAPASGSAKHYGYAFQWGAMAALIVVLYFWFHVRSPRKEEVQA